MVIVNDLQTEHYGKEIIVGQHQGKLWRRHSGLLLLQDSNGAIWQVNVGPDQEIDYETEVFLVDTWEEIFGSFKEVVQRLKSKRGLDKRK